MLWLLAAVDLVADLRLLLLPRVAARLAVKRTKIKDQRLIMKDQRAEIGVQISVIMSNDEQILFSTQ